MPEAIQGSLGIDCKLFVNNVEFTNVKDVSLPLTKNEADITTRSNNGWRAKRPVLKDTTIDWQMVYDALSSNCATIHNAYLDDTKLRIRVEDDTGATLFDADCYIKDYKVTQAAEAASMVDVVALISKVY